MLFSFCFSLCGISQTCYEIRRDAWVFMFVFRCVLYRCGATDFDALNCIVKYAMRFHCRYSLLFPTLCMSMLLGFFLRVWMWFILIFELVLSEGGTAYFYHLLYQYAVTICIHVHDDDGCVGFCPCCFHISAGHIRSTIYPVRIWSETSMIWVLVYLRRTCMRAIIDTYPQLGCVCVVVWHGVLWYRMLSVVEYEYEYVGSRGEGEELSRCVMMCLGVVILHVQVKIGETSKFIKCKKEQTKANKQTKNISINDTSLYVR